MYNLLSLYYATCMYVFWSYQLALDNQCESSSTSPLPSSPQLFPIAHCVDLRPSGVFPTHYGEVRFGNQHFENRRS